MHFASPVPWWLAAFAAAVVLGLAWLSYRRPIVALSPVRRGLLTGLRALSLGIAVLLLSRPFILVSPADDRNVAVPILVDVSRSMRVADADGQTRIARAVDVLQNELLAKLSTSFAPEVFGIGEALTPSSPDRLSADARQSDLSGALASVRERYRSRRVAGVVVMSDGGDTGGSEGSAPPGGTAPAPVFTVGVGSPEGIRDREILSVVAGDPRLDQTSVDLHVSAVSHRYGRDPFRLRLLANGRLLATRTVTPAADGSPVDETFTVSPDPVNATVYTAEIAPEPDETIGENNVFSVLVSPAGRKRRVLALAGAPGYEQGFMARALTIDPGLDVDTVVRKGRNENGEDTFFIQAGGDRAALLTSGFPATREALYGYDALIIANIEGDFFTRAQLAQTADFVAERGGGLVVLGGRSFAQRGLIGTPIEEALPVELNDRRGIVRTAIGAVRTAPQNTVVVTAEGERHPVMRLSHSPEETRQLWAAMPSLAATALLGGPKPGATVLAVTTAPAGTVHPLVAVQRYGSGRSMVFGGEASWRWRMLQPADDRSHEFFWRQAVRWLAGPAPDPVSLTVPDTSEPGDSIELAVDVRDPAFSPVADASLDATLTVPGGEIRSLALRRESATTGRFAAALRPTAAGLYRVQVEARRGTDGLGSADRWFYVGGRDREFAEPRLNEGVLRRVAQATGGQYVRTADVSRVIASLESMAPLALEPERRELWHEPWVLLLMVGLLSAEWFLRRRWGLR
jgi:uncharacterized membrane protein